MANFFGFLVSDGAGRLQRGRAVALAARRASTDIDPAGAAVLGRAAQMVNATIAIEGLDGVDRLSRRRLKPHMYDMDNEPVGRTPDFLDDLVVGTDPSRPRMWIDLGRVILGPALVFEGDRPLKLFLVTRRPGGVSQKPHENLIWFIVFGAMGSALLAYGLSRQLSRPVLALRRWAGELGANLDAPAPAGVMQRVDETGALARELKGMASRVSDQLEAQRALTRMVSHEVRSPLTKLKLVLDLLERAPDQAQRLMPRAHHQIRALDQLLEQMLTLSRLDADAWALEKTDRDWPLRINQWAQDWREQAHANGLVFECDGEPFDGAADPTLTKIALDNLISNAMALSDPGAMVRLETQADGFTVQDRAGGMAPELLAQAAEPFFQGVTPSGNSGLGLAIVHRIARVHGGELVLVNQQGGLSARLRLR